MSRIFLGVSYEDADDAYNAHENRVVEVRKNLYRRDLGQSRGYKNLRSIGDKSLHGT